MVLVMFFGSIVFALMVPAAMKRAHVRRQDRLLDRCRALFVLAVQAIEHTNEAAARSYLVRIRRIETRWQYGNSMVFRVAFALWAIGGGIVGYTFLRALALLPLDNRLPTSADILRFAEMAPLFAIFAGVASLHAMTSYFGEWTSWWAVNDCGDRLERMLNAERHVAAVSDADAFNPIVTT